MFALLLLALLAFQPAVSRGSSDTIFNGGFENPCGFEPSGPPPLIESISLGAGSAGSAITVNGQRLQASAFRVFLVGPLPNRPLQVELNISERQQARIVGSLDDPLRVGSYDVVLQTCSDDLVLAGAYQTPALASAFAAPGDQVVMTGAAFGMQAGSVLVEESGAALEAAIVNWQDDELVYSVDTGHASNGARDLSIVGANGMLRLIDALMIHGVDDAGDSEGPRLVSASAASNTTVIAQFSEAIVGGPDGAGDASLYRITAPARLPTVNVLSAQVLPPDFSRVRLTTMSQSDLVYTLKVSGITDLAGNPLAAPDILVDPTRTEFAGIPPDAGDVIDSDGDGLTDSVEQRGWTVNVRTANGPILTVSVTSNPGDPRLPPDDPVNLAARDSDGDGLADADEKAIGLNPRDPDTDGDTLADSNEWNEIFANPADQDSDGDSLIDGSEFNFFKTSPILADSDGDQLGDDVEIDLANRNPRIADLPSPTIEVGETNLQLDVRFLESTSQSTDEIESRTVSSTLTQDSSRTVSNTNSNTQEAMAKLSVGTEYKVSGSILGPGGEFTSSINAETGWTGSWTTSHTAESTQSTQQAYQDSLEEQVAVSEGATVEREVFGARMQVTLSLKSTTNLAYFLRNLQVTALKQDQLDPTVLTPIATLVPDQEPPDGFSLGPLNPERGPIILSSDAIFPQQVEDLMRNPRGLIFKISNFDIVDELGRNFVFTSQDITDRTATLVIDNGSFDEDGDGAGDLTEYVRVATGSGRVVDTNEDGVIDASDRRIVFDAQGRQVGVTLTDALEALGLERYRENCPPDDEAPDCRPTSTLTNVEIENSYSVQREGPGGADPNGERERIFRIRNTAMDNLNPNKAWEIITPTGIDTVRSIDDFILETESDLKLAFVQDLDQDRLTDGVEFLNGCSDNDVDSDGDARLDDRFEVLIGWDVETGRGARRVFSRCATLDSDGDGLKDLEEAPANFVFEEGTPQLIASATRLVDDNPFTPFDFVTDPSRRDTDDDGVEDFEEINGYIVELRTGGEVTVETDPNDPDTDGDGAADGLERELGGNPTVADVNDFTDADGDGLVNIVETDGWTVRVETVSTAPATCNTLCDPGVPSERTATSDPLVADTDFDGLLDSDEFALRSDPLEEDTDGDGLSDAQEVLGIEIRDLGIVVLDPLDADSDNDKRTDGDEAELVDVEAERWIVRVGGQDPYRVFSDPTQADQDFDTLVDGDERVAGGTGSDPAIADTDEDGRTDADEILRNTNPLIEDFRVTVRYHRLTIKESCDGDGDQEENAGDFVFTLGVNTPANSFLPIVSPVNLFIDDVIDACTDVNDFLCFGSGDIQLDEENGEDTVNLDGYSASFGVNANQEFALAGSIRELDDDRFDPAVEFTLDDRFNRTLDVDGSMRNGFFLGSELRNGPIIGTFRKTGACGLDLEVSIVPEN